MAQLSKSSQVCAFGLLEQRPIQASPRLLQGFQPSWEGLAVGWKGTKMEGIEVVYKGEDGERERTREHEKEGQNIKDKGYLNQCSYHWAEDYRSTT